jgi:hypothetical protein
LAHRLAGELDVGPAGDFAQQEWHQRLEVFDRVATRARVTVWVKNRSSNISTSGEWLAEFIVAAIHPRPAHDCRTAASVSRTSSGRHSTSTRTAKSSSSVEATSSLMKSTVPGKRI